MKTLSVSEMNQVSGGGAHQIIHRAEQGMIAAAMVAGAGAFVYPAAIVGGVGATIAIPTFICKTAFLAGSLEAAYELGGAAYDYFSQSPCSAC